VSYGHNFSFVKVADFKPLPSISVGLNLAKRLGFFHVKELQLAVVLLHFLLMPEMMNRAVLIYIQTIFPLQVIFFLLTCTWKKIVWGVTHVRIKIYSIMPVLGYIVMYI
jgi:hypothetical protein